MEPLQITRNAKRIGAFEEIRALRRRAAEARARRDAYSARLKVLEQAKSQLIESAKRCGVDLQSYADRYYASNAPEPAL